MFPFGQPIRSKSGHFINKKQIQKNSKFVCNLSKFKEPSVDTVDVRRKFINSAQFRKNFSFTKKYVTVSQIEPSDPPPRAPTSTDPPTPDETPELHPSENAEPEVQLGRRIVDLGHLAKQMVCSDCGEVLHLQQTIQERRRGFGSTLYIQCQCGFLNSATTSTTHHVNKKGPPVYDVNTKAALGMLHCGSGHTQISGFMSTLGVPGLHHVTMKRREEEVAPLVNTIASSSCLEALQAEIADPTRSSSDPVQCIPTCTVNRQREECPAAPIPALPTPALPTPALPTTPAPALPVAAAMKYDMGWQKRGSGRSYDSRSGVGCMIGARTGKICSYAVRSKDCRKCFHHHNKGEVPPSHTCGKNWFGSSKAMEPDVGAQLVREVESHNVTVNTIIMDDDATTMAKLKQTVNHDIVKFSDLNHTKKNLGNNLYALQKKHKVLSTKVIRWLQKCFSYAVAQNKDDVVGLRAALSKIVPHAFGNHTACNNSWCNFLSHPDTYKHKSLPYGRNLAGIELREDLDAAFAVFIKNSAKIAPGASTQDVESFNNMVATKAPKRIHYSASKSLETRVGCAVAQKNEGVVYINKVNVLLGLSPGSIAQKFAEKKDAKRKKRIEFESTKSFKKMKMERKLNLRAINSTNELKEGVTYQSGIAVNASTSSTPAADVTSIPACTLVPVPTQISQSDGNFKHIFCDIETTSLAKSCSIIQVAAVCEDDKFNEYILPSKPISKAASEITGLSLHCNALFLNGSPVAAIPLKESLQLLLDWLHHRQPCILIGHNFKIFDFPRLMAAFEMCHLLKSLEQSVHGIVDTLPLFRDIHPGLDSYRQQNLVTTFCNETYEAHNALSDVVSLQKLVNVSNVASTKLDTHSYTTSYMVERYHYDKQCQQNACTLNSLYEQKTASKLILNRIAGSGLCLDHLKLVISRDGLAGLTDLLTEKVNGKPRVTATRCIIEKIFKHLT